MSIRRMRCFAALVAGGLLALACARETPTQAEVRFEEQLQATGSAQTANSSATGLAALRRATALFHNFATAQAAGYSVQITPCFSSAEGGMGYHYGNPSLIDGSVSLLEPELLLYEPQADGSLRFVAVEYIVPLTAWPGSEPPELFGQHFHRNDAFGIWALHVWVWRHNPRGLFADWNPRVSCVAGGD